jgi:uncharacterized membrane protein
VRRAPGAERMSPRRRIRGDDLATPRRSRLSLGIHYDPDAFGEFSETIARTIGTARFLVIQTVIVVIWIAVNAIIGGLRFDPYPFILLTLALSLQAAYAAPLILLAQNRQADRDRTETERDRDVNARITADTEFLARELSSIRLALADVVTNEDLRDAIDRLHRALEAGPSPADS